MSSDASDPDGDTDADASSWFDGGSTLDSSLRIPDAAPRDIGPVEMNPIPVLAEWRTSAMAGVAMTFSESKFFDRALQRGAIISRPVGNPPSGQSCLIEETITSTGAAFGFVGRGTRVLGATGAIGSPHSLGSVGPGRFASPLPGLPGSLDANQLLELETLSSTTTGELGFSSRDIYPPPALQLRAPATGTPIDLWQPIVFGWLPSAEERTTSVVFELFDAKRRVVLRCTAPDEDGASRHFTFPVEAVQLFLLSEPTPPAFIEASYEEVGQRTIPLVGSADELLARYVVSNGVRFEVF